MLWVGWCCGWCGVLWVVWCCGVVLWVGWCGVVGGVVLCGWGGVGRVGLWVEWGGIVGGVGDERVFTEHVYVEAYCRAYTA